VRCLRLSLDRRSRDIGSGRGRRRRGHGDARQRESGEAEDRFGNTLSVGNFDGDFQCVGIYCFPFDDLAIGTPFEDLGSGNEKVDAGEVTVLYGAEFGFFDWTDHLTQGSIFGSTADDQSGDRFGFALAAGDFDGDGDDELAVGHPGEDDGGSDRGGVTLLRRTTSLGAFGGFRFFAAGRNGVPPGVQSSSSMGRSLSVGDFDGDGYPDLAIGIPHRDDGDSADTGAETILYGAMFADGFESGNRSFWSMSTP
jgi:hypothetical protein